MAERLNVLDFLRSAQGSPTPRRVGGPDMQKIKESSPFIQDAVAKALSTNKVNLNLPELNEASGFIQNAVTDNLVERERNKIEHLGGEAPPRQPEGTLSRVFDVLQRPLYGVAEGTRRVVENVGKDGLDFGDFGGAVTGALSGVAGKSKTSFSDVLDEAGVENKLVKGAVGFAGDVLLDPLSYVGIGLVSKANKVDALGVAVKKAVKTADSKAFLNKVEKAGLKAEEAAKQKALKDKAAGKKVDFRVANASAERVKKTAINKARKDLLSKTYNDTLMKELMSKPGEFNLTFAGKNVLKVKGTTPGKAEHSWEFLGKKVWDARSPLPLLTQSKVGDWIVTGPGQMFKKAFLTSTFLPGQTKMLQRMFEGKGVANFDDWVRFDLEPIAKTVSKDERNEISHLLEGNVLGIDSKKRKSMTTDEITAAIEGAILELSPQGQALARFAQKAQEDLYLVEEAAGLFELGQKLPHYVFHTYTKGNKKEISNFKNARKKPIAPDRPGFTVERQVPTLKDAEAAGFAPITDIAEVLKRRVEKHHQAMARWEFTRSLVGEYGILAKKAVVGGKAVSDKELQKLAKELNLVKVKDDRYLRDHEAWVPAPIAKVFEFTQRAYQDDDTATGFLRFFGQVQNAWKTGATVMNPGHHFRNITGDIFLNYIDGVKNPAYYRRALKVLDRAMHRSEVKKIHVGKTISNSPVGSDITNKWLWEKYASLGLKSGFTRAELGATTEKFNVGSLVENIRRISTHREDTARMAHWLYALEDEVIKSGGLSKGKPHAWKQLNAASERAAARVNKWNFDYGDLTESEKIIKNVVPFYTFARKNLPRMLEAIAMRPHKVVKVPKAQRMFQQMLGTDEEYLGAENSIPLWLKESAALRVTTERNPIYLGFDLPIQEALTRWSGSTQDVASNLFGMLTPALTVPAEISTGRSIFTGGPRAEGMSFFAGLVPGARLADQLIDGDLSVEEKAVKLANWITGAGIQRVTPRVRQGELRRQEQVAQEIIRKLKDKNRAEWEKSLGGG